MTSTSVPNVNDLLTQTKTRARDFIIDGINFGRGETFPSYQSQDVRIWKVVEQNLEEIVHNKNHFYDTEIYLVQINLGESGTLYFYWKGDRGTKKYSPLPDNANEVDCIVERITQWAEPPAFLRIFRGSLVVHLSHQNDHLYILRGEIEDELHLYEVPNSPANLRSRTSFLMLHNGSASVWNGNRSSDDTRTLIEKITSKVFPKLSVNVTNEESSPGTRCEQPRLFYINDITGAILATEVSCSHSSDFVTPFPFLQSHLYTAAQPAVFLLDDGCDTVWLWRSPAGDVQNSLLEAAKINCDNYAQAKSLLQGPPNSIRVKTAVSGSEPREFKHLFPLWTE